MDCNWSHSYLIADDKPAMIKATSSMQTIFSFQIDTVEVADLARLRCHLVQVLCCTQMEVLLLEDLLPPSILVCIKIIHPIFLKKKQALLNRRKFNFISLSAVRQKLHSGEHM